MSPESRAGAQVVLAHQAVEIDRRRGARVGLVVADLGHAGDDLRQLVAAGARCVSTGVPAGMSTTTWNSDLLSKGSIFSTTSFTTTRPTASTIAAAIAQ